MSRPRAWLGDLSTAPGRQAAQGAGRAPGGPNEAGPYALCAHEELVRRVIVPEPDLARCLPPQERKLRKGLAELQEAHAQQVAAVLDRYTALRAAVDQHHRQLEQVRVARPALTCVCLYGPK